ncbi:MAG: polysaccharide deacetylase family protein [Clostridia bacterium]|nr:polysaccharide deacetylase family protein [Clostridia bacterium]
MKKLVSILLLVFMLFGLCSCSSLISGIVGGNNNSETSSNTGSSTNSGTSNTNTESNTNSNTQTNTTTNTGTYVPPILDHDTIKYEAKYTNNKKTNIKYGSYTVKAPIITEYYNDYEAAVSMTFDDGADVAAAQVASNIMAQYGIRGTLMVNIASIQGNVSQWQNVVKQGVLDIGSHGWDHLDPSTIATDQLEHEIKDSFDYLHEYFPNENPLTYATPLSHITDEYEDYLIYCGFIANRLETGGKIIAPSDTDINMHRLGAARIDVAYKPSQVQINVADAISRGDWFIELYHNIRDSSHSTDLPAADFEAHCQWLYNNYNGKVWFGSYDDVAKYVAQYQTATIEYKACDNESMTFMAKVDKNYGQEMTLKIYMPFFIDSAYAIINGEEIYLTVEKEPNTRVVYINTELSEEGTEIKIMMSGNDKYFNNCNHTYVKQEEFDATETEFGYTVMICTGCAHTYVSSYTDKTASSVSPTSTEISTPVAIVPSKEQ